MNESPTHQKKPDDKLALLLAILTVIPAACNQLVDAAHKVVQLIQLFF
ncbi:hypothetical protein SFC66_04900 [Terribacillus saccharophilus]